MSLFKARQWWATVSGYEEFHDLGCLAVGNLDNSATALDKIVVGSFQGLVRIYKPNSSQFSASHVILEQQFSSPVLQVAVGRFVKGSAVLHLAILHPRELAVCTLTSEETSDGSVVYQLSSVYKHSLQHTACNMIWGTFGADTSGGCEGVCVQSMDGQLAFYTQGAHSFSCFLPDFLVPGPLAYAPRTDSLVTVNSAHSLQVFRYQTLAVVGGAGRDTGKRFTTDWCANIGETAIDIQVVTPPTGAAQILVLGERSVFSFKDNGILQFMKKLDFNPTCFYCYSSEPPTEGEETGAVRYMVAAHTGQVLILRDTTLVWAASLEHTPVQLLTGAFRELEGVIVSLDELGHLTCSYLGTDPTIFAATPTSQQRAVNYQELDRELASLNQQIRKSQKEGSLSERGDVSTLLITSLVDPDTVRTVQLDEEGVGPDETTPIKKCVEIQLNLSSSSGPALSNVTVGVASQLPLTTHPSHFTLSEVSSTHSHAPLSLTVVATPTLLPTSTYLTLSATYTSNEGFPHAIRHEVELPVHLFCEPDLPDKTATHKITIEVNHYAKDLTQLFPRQLVHPSSPSNAIGIAFLNSTKVTIVASPSSSRYRLQSDSLATLGAGLELLLSMLSKQFAGHVPAFKATFAPPLPLTEYFEIIERHYRLRVNIEHCKEWLSRHSQQFRAIQKRLLTRFKDKTPVGLAHLDTLLDGTYMQLMALSEKNELFLLELQECSNQLSCATQLINTLLRLATEMSDVDYNVLMAALSPCVTMETEQGWEESTDAAVTHLLRTTLSKSAREVGVGVASVEMPAESSKLKKHIALLCDRLLKGFHPAVCRVEATQSLSKGESVEEPLPQITPLSIGGDTKIMRRKPHPSRLPSLPETGEGSPETT